MTVYPLLHELRVVGIYDRGHPVRERVVIEVLEDVDLGDYCLIFGQRTESGTLRPSRALFQSLPSEYVEAGTWVFLYSGAGVRTETTTQNGSPALVLHMNRPPLFQSPSMSLAVLAIAGIALAP